MFSRVAAAFLAGLCEIGSVVRLIDLLVRIGDNRDFERDRIGKRVIKCGVECDADDQDAVYQGGKEQHGGQSVRHRRRNEQKLVERVLVQGDIGHTHENVPLFCLQ